jgi:hypothetical protein
LLLDLFTLALAGAVILAVDDVIAVLGLPTAVAQPGIGERLDRLRIVRPQSSYLGVG